GGVYEIYDEGYKAKRLEVGAVIGAVPRKNVVRQKPQPGDVILLLGGKTGRDGIGGATGSSKIHTEKSCENASEVQKGNPVIERKIQRLFRNPAVTKLIKKCNDFGAGGVCVAIGELADSLEINLDAVPKKYEGLDGTEIAVSESQERMAIVIAPEHVSEFMTFCKEENIEVTCVAHVTDSGRLVMKWREQEIFSVSREFLDTNGARQAVKAQIAPADLSFFDEQVLYDSQKTALTNTLQDLNVCSKKGLSEHFDSTIGAGTVVMPFGGKNMITPPCAMVAKIPVLDGETSTCSIMSYGYNPNLTKKSTFHGGLYAVLESLAKIVAVGGDYTTVRLSFQEYFERMSDAKSWGKPLSALLGAFLAQKKLCTPAIGGKDSMSGTFKDLHVPETIISFAVTAEKAQYIITPELKANDSYIVLVDIKQDSNHIPDFDDVKKKYSHIYALNKKGNIVSAQAVGFGGIIASLATMAMGNAVGFEILTDMNILCEKPGAILLEVKNPAVLDGLDYTLIAKANDTQAITFIDGESISIDECIALYEKPLESVFRTKVCTEEPVKNILFSQGTSLKAVKSIAQPRVFIPVFPGTNCEYDTKHAFEKAGATADVFVFRNTHTDDIAYSVREFVTRINNAQMIALPGGFSAGDEPDGSAKFIAAVFRNPDITQAVHKMLYERDGLMLG
ncbi:MAG: phosphoribosylformylglycinamidine synthase subunit PurQ, partial [Spirochaetales bacterium]